MTCQPRTDRATPPLSDDERDQRSGRVEHRVGPGQAGGLDRPAMPQIAGFLLADHAVAEELPDCLGGGNDGLRDDAANDAVTGGRGTPVRTLEGLVPLATSTAPTEDAARPVDGGSAAAAEPKTSTAESTSNGPTRVRRNRVRWPPTPSAAPRSRASDRM